MAKAKLERKTLKDKLVPVDIQPYTIPGNWCWTYLSCVCAFENGYAFKSERFAEEGIPVIRISNIKDNEVDIDDCVYTSETDVEERFLVKKGDLLIAMSGATTGKNGVYLLEEKAYLNQRVGNIKVIDRNVISERFRNYYIMSKREDILRSAYGGAQPNISSAKIGEMPLPLPPLSEQQRIVGQIESLFFKLDEANVKIQDTIDDSENRKSAILFKAYSGDLTEEWRVKNNIKRTGWKSVKLSEVCKINPPKIDCKDLDDDMEVSFYPMPALSEITGTITDPQVRKISEVKKGFTNFSEGDVVFAKITPCMENGKSAIIGKLVNDIGYGTTEFFVMRCSKELLNIYLYHMVRSKRFRDEAKAVMTGAVGQQRVPKSFLEEYKIELPSVDEQAEIIRIVDDAICKEQIIVDNCEKVMEQINMMKRTILAKAFRGELGTNDLSEESSIELLKQVIANE